MTLDDLVTAVSATDEDPEGNTYPPGLLNNWGGPYLDLGAIPGDTAAGNVACARLTLTWDATPGASAISASAPAAPPLSPADPAFLRRSLLLLSEGITTRRRRRAMACRRKKRCAASSTAGAGTETTLTVGLCCATASAMVSNTVTP